MRIFLTGAASFIGGELLRHCSARGIEVVGIDRVAVGPGHAVGDIRDRAVADLIPEGTDAIVHLAALSRDPDCRDRGYDCFDVNVMGTLNLIDAAARRGVKQFVFASSEWVYGDFGPGEEKSESSPIDPRDLRSEYALSKLVAEANLRQKHQHGFCPVTVLRFGIVYGPRPTNWSAVEMLVDAVAKRDEISIGSRRTGRRFIHVSDIASGILASLGRTAFETFNIQGPGLVTLGEIVEQAAAQLGRRPRLVETDPARPSVRAVSAAHAAKELGWRAGIDIRAGVADLIRGMNLQVSKP